MSLLEELNSVMENTLYDCLEKDLGEAGFSVYSDLEPEEEIQEYSTDISWSGYIYVEKDKESFKVYCSGGAIAEISYGTWTESFGHEIEDYSIEKD